jgi:cell division protein FtsI/penicillin-binding protein 2
MNSTHIQLIARRTATLYAVIIVFGIIIVARLFQLQVLQHDYYADLAISEHEAKFVIPAARGSISARDGTVDVPLVLNEVLPTVYADPAGIYDTENEATADKLSSVLDVDKEQILEQLSRNESRYQVIKKQATLDQVNELKEMSINGVGFADESYRVYPQGNLSAQTLGFVNNEGSGQYGIEEYLNDQLAGEDGRFEAVTDVYGIPLSTSEQKVIASPEDGDDITLTIDVNIQRQVEEALEKGVKSSQGKSGSAIVMDPNTGAILAMANYPTFDPAAFGEQEEFSRFVNGVVSSAYETGSGMKVLTMASAINEGAVNKNTTFFDAGFVQVDDRRIENAGGGGGGQRTMTEVIQRSVNTGVVFALQQMGGGEINRDARDQLHSYFTDKYGFGAPTGIAQANEAGGLVFSPDDEEGNNVRYANMTFGQGMTVTMLQMAAAVSSIVNGGDYYQPYLVHSTTHSDGSVTESQPNVIRESIISEKTSKDLREMMQSVITGGGGLSAKREGYSIGGKTGTAQVLDPRTGEYSDDLEIGSFVGFGGSIGPQYVIMTRVDEPKIPGFAGTVAAAPIFADISNFMIDYYQIPPNQ